MKNEKTIQVQPSAHNLIESMRSMGYSFETALADIIDNSIGGKASEIKIYFNEYGSPSIQIFDNGIGMNEEELISSMRLGSRNPKESREERDLGRFGLGMKSASFSQCKLLTVVSKKKNEIAALQWNLDYIAKTDKFEVIVLSSKEISEIINMNVLKAYNSGTLVMWEEFDKIKASSNSVKTELEKLLEKAIEHIGLIYHRFIGDGLKIAVNEIEIVAKDPFLIKHDGTQPLQEQAIYVEEEKIILQPYILPHFSALNAKDKRLSGKVQNQYKDQGFYLYRNKRLIIWGSYFGLSRKTELSKNLRIRVDIPNSLDYLWDIDVKKSQARLPSKITKSMLLAVSNGELESKKVNNYKGTKELNFDNAIWNVMSDRDGKFILKINEENYIYKKLEEQMNDEQKALFKDLIDKVIREVPAYRIYSEIGRGNQVECNVKDIDRFKERLEILKNIENFDYMLHLRQLLNSKNETLSSEIIEYIRKEMEEENDGA